MESTTMDETEFTTFYDKTIVNSFGAGLVVDLEDIAEEYSCPSSEYKDYGKNCTAEYLARGQWGSSMITA